MIENINMSKISPKLIDVERCRVEYIDDTDKKTMNCSNRKTKRGWCDDAFVGGYEGKSLVVNKDYSLNSGRFPTQLFTNIKNDRFKYVKNIT